MRETPTRFAERGWPLASAGPSRIVLAEGRIGAISIFDTRAGVERILGVERKSLWGMRDESPSAVALRISFESDQKQLYDSEEMLLAAREWDEVLRLDHDPREEPVEAEVMRRLDVEQRRIAADDEADPLTDEIAIAPEADAIIDLELDWGESAAIPGVEPDAPDPVVVFPEGMTVRCAELRVHQLNEVLGAPPVAEEFDEDLLLGNGRARSSSFPPR